MKIVSACLVGINCRYDGKNNKDKAPDELLEEYQKGNLIPVCPEQLGGLPTPRVPSEKKENKVLTKSGKDFTENFNRGAQEVLKIAKQLNIKEAIFKQRSPSCGCGKIYDGTFSHKIIKGDGITTALLKRNGIKVISEEDI